MVWSALITAGMSAAQYKAQQDREDRDRRLAAQTQAYSPWTGLQAGNIREADLVGTIGQGAVQGVAMEQQMDAAENQKKLQEAQMKYYNRATPTAAPGPGGEMPMGEGSAPALADSYGKFGTNGAWMSQDPRLGGRPMSPWEYLAKQNQYYAQR